jgi:outer membrane protein OmpA-like peptidoglycan-associated protein
MMLGIKDRIPVFASKSIKYFQVFWGASSLITEDDRAAFRHPKPNSRERRKPMKSNFCLTGLMIMFLFLCTSCVSHFGVENRAAMVPDDFGQTEAAIARAEQSQGAQYCPDKIAQAKELARQGAETYWACKNTESSRLLAEARRLAEEAERCGPGAAAVAPIEPLPAAEAAPRYKYCVTFHPEFDICSAEIRTDYQDRMARAGKFMQQYPDTTAIIEGHTDNSPITQGPTCNYRDNMALSLARAESAVKYLVEKFGIDRSRFTAKGYGDTRPVADNATDEGKQKNRRIEAIVDCAVLPQEVKPEERLCMTLQVEFATGKADIKARYSDEITKLADYMKKYPTTTATIEGHTDNVGSPELNMKLSQQRAENVVSYLVDKFGIDRSRLSAKGYGESRPIAYNTTSEGRQKNRRIEASVDCVIEK